MPELTIIESSELAQHESTIQRGLNTFVEVGAALLAIRDGKLYRAEFGTFEEYCQERWGITPQQGHRLMAASVTVKELEPIGSILPATESQARPLTQLEPEQKREAWALAVDTAPNGKVTAAHVQSVVDEYIAPEKQASNVYQPVAATMFSHISVEYYTPEKYIDAVRSVLGEIELDPASCEEAQRTVKAISFYTQETDGLAQPWAGKVFLNPPYGKESGKGNQELWSLRLIDEYQKGNVKQAVLLVKAALGYKWFENLFEDYPVCFSRERLSFMREDGDDEGQSKQGTAFFYIGKNPAKFYKVFSKLGRVIPPRKTIDEMLF